MSIEPARSYGHGAAGERTAAPTRKPSLLQRMRYRFDNSISRGQAAFAAWLFFFGILTSGVLAVLRWLVNDIDTTAPNAYRDLFIGTANIVLFDDKVRSGAPIQRVVFFLMWVASVTISATIIAFIANRLRERADSLRNGKSSIIESGHTVILGWSNRAYPIIQQLAVAGRNQRRSVIAVFAPQASGDIEDAITARVSDLGGTKLVIRKGDPTNPQDLLRTNLAAANAIIVLDEDTAGDANVISTVLAVTATDAGSQVPMIAEIDNPAHAEALRQATGGRVQTVQSNDVIARVTAQASRQPGLASVVLDLLDFEGDEIYFQTVPQLAGQTYGDALISFNKAAVIGVRRPDGRILLNPPASTRLAADDQVIAIAADDDQVIFTGIRKDLTNPKLPDDAAPSAQRPEHLLVIGWSQMGNAVMNELAQFLPTGSTVHIVANPSLVDTSELPTKNFHGIPVTFSPNTGSVSDLAQAASRTKYDEVIVLAYRENIAVAEADAQTMLTMLLMNKLFAEEGNGVEPTRLVAEIIDSRRADLARVASSDDIVVSDKLAALMIAQMSQNPELSPVFADLFDADGASLNVRPIELYAQVGESVEFAALVAAARSRGESAIGYRTSLHPKGDPTAGVVLNPAKDHRFTVAAGDALVVIGDVRGK